MQEANVVTSENVDAFYAKTLNLEPQAPAQEEVKTEAKQDEKQLVVAAEAGSDTPAKTEDDPKSGEQKNELERRFSKLTKQREDAKREAAKEREAREALERKLVDAEAKLNPPKQESADDKPKQSDFNDPFQYAEKLAEWTANNVLREREKTELQRKLQQERERVSKDWSTRQEAFRAETPDYQDMIDSADVSVSDPIRDAILDSDIGPKILYHLAANPELAKEWAEKSDSAALRAFGRLEERLAGKPVEKPAEQKVETKVETKPQISKALEPITPIKNATALTDNLIDGNGEFKGTYQQFKELSKAGKIK